MNNNSRASQSYRSEEDIWENGTEKSLRYLKEFSQVKYHLLGTLDYFFNRYRVSSKASYLLTFVPPPFPPSLYYTTSLILEDTRSEISPSFLLL